MPLDQSGVGALTLTLHKRERRTASHKCDEPHGPRIKLGDGHDREGSDSGAVNARRFSRSCVRR